VFESCRFDEVHALSSNGPHIDKLIGEGKYDEAFEFLKAGIEKNNTLHTYSATYYAGLEFRGQSPKSPNRRRVIHI